MLIVIQSIWDKLIYLQSTRLSYLFQWSFYQQYNIFFQDSEQRIQSLLVPLPEQLDGSVYDPQDVKLVSQFLLYLQSAKYVGFLEVKPEQFYNLILCGIYFENQEFFQQIDTKVQNKTIQPAQFIQLLNILNKRDKFPWYKNEILTILIGIVQNPQQLFNSSIMWQLQLQIHELSELLTVISNSKKLTRDQQSSCILDLIINSNINEEEKQQLLDQNNNLPINPRKIMDQNFPGTQEQKVNRIKKLISQNCGTIEALQKEKTTLNQQLQILQAQQSSAQPSAMNQRQAETYSQAQYSQQPQKQPQMQNNYDQPTQVSQPASQLGVQIRQNQYADGPLVHFEGGFGCEKQKNVRNIKLGCNHHFCEYCLLNYIFNKVSLGSEVNVEKFKVVCPQFKINQQKCEYKIKTSEFLQIQADLQAE